MKSQLTSENMKEEEEEEEEEEEDDDDDDHESLALYYGGEGDFFVDAKYGWGVEGNETGCWGKIWNPKSDFAFATYNAKYILYFGGPKETKPEFKAYVENFMMEWKLNHPTFVFILK